MALPNTPVSPCHDTRPYWPTSVMVMLRIVLSDSTST